MTFPETRRQRGRSFAARYASILLFAAFAFTGLPAAAQTINAECRLAEPNSQGQHVSEICWFQFGTTGERLVSGSGPRSYDFSLPDGSRITMDVAVTGGTYTPTSQRGLEVAQAPTWEGSNFSGTSGYYTILTPNAAALHSEGGRGNGSVLTASNIRLFRPNGSEVTDVPFEMIFADAERLNSNPERMDFGVTSGGAPFQVLEWLGGVSPTGTIWSGVPGADTGGAASACWTGGGGGSPVGVDCIRFRGLSGGNAPSVVLSTQRAVTGPQASQPFTVMGQIHSGAGQSYAIGVRWGSVRLRKVVPEGRIDAADQFTYRLTNVANVVVAEHTTDNSMTETTPSPWISTTAMPGNVITIEEVMAPGSESVLGQYSSWVRCEGGVGGSSTTIIDQAYNPANPPQINLDASINEPGYNIDCEIINRPVEHELNVRKALSLVDGQPHVPGDMVAPGQTLAYTITIENVGDVEAILPAGAVTESLPESTTLDPATTDFSCLLNSCGSVDQLTIPAGGSVDLIFVINVDDPFDRDPREVRNIVAVAGVDCADAGNECEVEVPVSEEADLAIAKSAAQEEVASGESIDYTLLVSNLGPATVTGATVTDEPPDSGLTCPTTNAVTCDSTASPSACPAGPLTIQDLLGGVVLGTLPADDTVTLTYTCVAD